MDAQIRKLQDESEILKIKLKETRAALLSCLNDSYQIAEKTSDPTQKIKAWERIRKAQMVLGKIT